MLVREGKRKIAAEQLRVSYIVVLVHCDRRLWLIFARQLEHTWTYLQVLPWRQSI